MCTFLKTKSLQFLRRLVLGVKHCHLDMFYDMPNMLYMKKEYAPKAQKSSIHITVF